MFGRLAYFSTALVLGYLVVTFSTDAARLSTIASTQLNLENSTELAWKSILENLSFSLYSGATDTKAQVEALFNESERRSGIALYAALAFLLATIIYLGWQLRKRSHVTKGAGTPSAMTRDLLALTVVCLAIGLVAPILALKAHADMPVVGEVILKYQSKSILTTVGGLFASGNFVVAILIAVFSVVTPALKVIVSIFIAQEKWPSLHERGVALIRGIGKWSMADVFVVAILVAYFAASSDDFSEARIGLGLYFFTAYCLLSQYATTRLIRETGHQQSI